MSAHQTIKVMLDTNVLISAVYNPSSTTFQAFRKASEPPYVLVLCDQVIPWLKPGASRGVFGDEHYQCHECNAGYVI